MSWSCGIAEGSPSAWPGTSLKGKVAVITGGAGGQGAEEVRLFRRLGAKVAVADVRHEEGAALVEQLGPDDTVYVDLDVRSETAWAKAVDVVLARFRRLDVLVNNAAIHWSRPLVEETAEGFNRILAVNLMGAFLGIRSVVPAMCEAGAGSIVNVSSTAGLNGLPGHAAYGSAKWGLRGLSKTAAIELGPRRIRVNTVIPGPINTPMMVPGDEQRFARLPLRRCGEPAEVAPLVAFLASDASSYVTGAEITVDGGASALFGIARDQRTQAGGVRE